MTPASLTAVPSGGRTSRGVDVQLDVKKVLAGMADVRLAYQPVVDLSRGTVVGYEALARFSTGLRGPGPWFAAAEESGRRADLEALVLQQALDARASAPPSTFVAANVSPRLVLDGPVWSTLVAAGDLTGLVLELTEHEYVENLPRLRRRLDTVREHGGILALDDVGAGWSGLRQVVELRPEIVKIARSLVSRLHDDPARAAVAELLGAFTERVGGTLLAEGVEQIEELTALLHLEVHLAQGYLLGRPQFGWSTVPAEVAALLATRSREERQVGSVARPVPVVPNLAAVGVLGEELPDMALVVRKGVLQGVWVRNHCGIGPSGWLRPLTTVPDTTTVRAALCRAMERPLSHRMDPMACVDESGVVTGVLAVDALVGAML
jgi:EAL domain-containing protein (putative c-di-GMP-specific phosphodiesterase class I)